MRRARTARGMSNVHVQHTAHNSSRKKQLRFAAAHTPNARHRILSAHTKFSRVRLPTCLAARQHTRCICRIIPRFSCQSYASAKHASAHGLAPRLPLPPTPLLLPLAAMPRIALLSHGSVLCRRIRACRILGRMDKGFLDGPCDAVQCFLNLIVAHLRNMSSLSSRCA